VNAPINLLLLKRFLELLSPMSIYVGNLAFSVTQDDLNEVFGEYGKVKRVQVPVDRETGRPRGFAFVEMETDAQEEKAIVELDGAEWMGRDLRVNKARPREERPAGGGGAPRRGDWENGGGGGGDRQRY
jgi:RNA recognition motif-containing protein